MSISAERQKLWDAHIQHHLNYRSSYKFPRVAEQERRLSRQALAQFVELGIREKEANAAPLCPPCDIGENTKCICAEERA